MESINQLIQSKVEKTSFPLNKGPNSSKSYWIDLTSQMLQKSFKQIAGLTSHLNEKAIKDLYEIANEFKTNPSALWWKLLPKTKGVDNSLD